MKITKQDLLTTAQELIDVLKLINNETENIPIEVSDAMTDEELRKFIIKASGFLEPTDTLHEVTSNIVKELTKAPDAFPLSIEEDIEKAETLKELRTLARSTNIFKTLEGKLGNYKDVMKLKEDMLNILILDEEPTEQDTILEEKTTVEPLENDSLPLSPQSSTTTSKMMKVAQIELKAPFKELFKIKLNTAEKIEKSMQVHGFDLAFPLVLWGNVLVDGYTRYAAALKLGLKEVPVEVKEFKDEKTALEYAIHNQRDRRNLSDAELLQLVELTDQKLDNKEAATKETKEGATVNKTAEALGVPASKVADARAVLADEEVAEEVKAGTTTLNKGARKARKKKKVKRLSEEQKIQKERIVAQLKKTRIEAVAQTIKELYVGKEVQTKELIEESDVLFVSWGNEPSMVGMGRAYNVVYEVLKALGIIVDVSADVIKIKNI